MKNSISIAVLAANLVLLAMKFPVDLLAAWDFAVISFLIFFFRALDNEFDMLNPLSYALITSVFVPFVVGFPVMYFIPPLEFDVTRAYQSIILLSGLCFILLQIGFFFNKSMAPLSVKLGSFRMDTINNNLIIKAIVLYLIGASAKLFYFSRGVTHIGNEQVLTGNAESLSFITPLLSFCDFSMLILFAIFFSSKKKWLLVIIICFFLFEVVFGFYYSSRTRIMQPFLVLVFAYHHVIKKIAAKYFIIFGIVVVMLVLPMLTLFKANYQYFTLTEGTNIDTKELIMRSLNNERGFTGDENFDGSTSRIYAALVGFTRVYDQVPTEVPYKYGGTFFPGIFTQMIPRAIWPAKEIYIPGREFSKVFWKRDRFGLTGTSEEISVFGELYYNFGLTGIILLVPLVGYLLSAFYSGMKKDASGDTFPLVRYFFYFNTIGFFFASGIQTVYVGLLKEFLFFMLFMVLFSSKFPSKKIQHAPVLQPG